MNDSLEHVDPNNGGNNLASVGSSLSSVRSSRVNNSETRSPISNNSETRSPISNNSEARSPISNSIRQRIRRLSLSGESSDAIEINLEDVSAAAYRIKSGIRRTACEVTESNYLLAYSSFYNYFFDWTESETKF